MPCYSGSYIQKPQLEPSIHLALVLFEIVLRLNKLKGEQTATKRIKIRAFYIFIYQQNNYILSSESFSILINMEKKIIEHQQNPLFQDNQGKLNGCNSNYSYIKNLQPFKPSVKQSYIPFIFRSKRCFPEEINKENSPPVGSYQLPSAFKNQRTRFQILQDRNIFIDDWNKKKQMHMFKSTQQRFINFHSNSDQSAHQAYKYNSASYSVQEKTTKKRANAHQKFRELVNLQNQSIINQSKTLQIIKSPFDIFQRCPSIPNTSTKFGYAHDRSGKAMVVQKSQKQIQKERQKSKNYNRTLNAETFYNLKQNKSYDDFQDRTKQSKINSNLLKTSYQKLKSFQGENQKNKTTDLTSQRSEKKIKLKGNKSYEKRIFNIKKIKEKQKQLVNQYLKQKSIKRQTQSELGPGFYELNLDTIKPKYKRQRYQFFGSTQVRFKQDSGQRQDTQPFEESQVKISMLPRDIPDYCTITSSFSKYNRPIKPKNLFSLRNRPKQQTKSCKNKVTAPGPCEYNQNLSLVKKNSQNALINVKKKTCYDQYKVRREKLRTQCRNKIKKAQKGKKDAQKYFILKSTKEVRTNKIKFRISFDDKALKKKRFQHIYKSGIPQKPQTIKGVIVTSKNSSVQKSCRDTPKMKTLGSYSKGKIAHLRSKQHSNDFQICSWEKQGKLDQKIFGFHMKKIDTEELQSIHISARNEA